MAFGEVKFGAQEAMNKLLSLGYKVDLLSARPLEKYESLKKRMVEYFEVCGINYNYLNIGFYSKAEFLKVHGYDILIDNDIKHIREAELVGVVPILYGLYNSEYTGYQTSEWSHIPMLIEEIIIDKKQE